jgi:alkaline phosphatase
VFAACPALAHTPFAALAQRPRCAGSDKEFVLDWTTSGHTGVPTVVTAEGVGSDALVGYHPNTHLHDVVHEVLFGR